MRFDDSSRLRALADYRVLDTPPEAIFDNIAKLTAGIFDTPISLVTFVDEQRQWFKAHFGLDLTETPREHSFCDHAIRADAPLVVNDATTDPRFAANPLVLQSPNIRFYCGVPLRTPDGQGLGTLCLIDDKPRTITPRELATLEALARHVELELEIRRRLVLLEEALGSMYDERRAKELLATMIVHDMRSPLTTIMMLASSIKPGDEQSRVDLEAVLSESERLRGMLADILDVCLHQVGSLRPRRTIFSLASLTGEVAARMRRLGGRASAGLSIQVIESPVMVDADPELVTRVLENLVSNALHHGGAPHPIVISFGQQDTGRVRVEVRDHGVTIPAAERTRIFQALAQGTPSSSHRGHGLGLTFCKLAIEAHGGTIAVRPNRDGPGNCFEFDLPAAAWSAEVVHHGR